MFKHPIYENYMLADASGEIIIMLLGAFLLGAMLGWLFRHLFGQDDSCKKCMNMGKKGKGAAMATGSKKQGVAKSMQDDLKKVEGIGPKIEKLLQRAGIMTWSDLAKASPSRLKGILNDAGKRYQVHDPATWPEQAAYARDGKWNKLKEYQEFLNKGRE